MCSVCRKEFGTRIMLEIHTRRCWTQASGTCPAKKTLLSESATNKKTYNSKHEPYYNLCNKEFASEQWLVIHQKHVDDIVQTYRCEICGVTYINCCVTLNKCTKLKIFSNKNAFQ